MRIWRSWMLYAAIPVAIVLVYSIVILDVMTDPERQAQRAVCAALAAEVRNGTATRFDYMATRCSAQLLTTIEKD